MADRKWFKGRTALALDAWYGTGDVQRNLEEARDLLQSDESYEAIVGELATRDRRPQEFDYPKSALQGEQFESVTRQGYLEAIGLALRHSPPVPIKTFWMTGVRTRRFEMHITDGDDQVSVTLLVPRIDGGSRSERSPESWMVSADRKGRVRSRQMSGPEGRERPCLRRD
jgi:hypothetical protein